jgi:exodeoxyribonuclease-3
MKIASWNVNSLNVRMPHLKQWLASSQPDIVALQETKLEDAKFPDTDIAALGYRCVFSGQKTYNGVALLAREMPVDIVTDVAGLDDPQRRILIASVGDLRIANLYVVNGQEVGSDKYKYKLDWLARVTDHLGNEAAKHKNLVVLGDFNIAPEDRDVHDPAAWHEKILCSTPEREALKLMQSIGLVDSYRERDSEAGKYSWWDYRQAGFQRNRGLRIDLVLASQALAPRIGGVGIDLEPRRWERPSDHAPATMELTP